MIRSGMVSSQSLPSLDSLMRRALGSESPFHSHGNQGNHQLGQASVADADRLLSSSFQQPQQPQQHSHRKQLPMVIPQAPLPLGNSSLINNPQMYPHGVSELEAHPGLGMPSPISPRLTRCPSLTESIFNTGTCPSPADSGPATPILEQNLSKHIPHGHSHSHKMPRMYHDQRSLVCDNSASSASAHRKHRLQTPPHTMLPPSYIPSLSSAHIHHQNTTMAVESEGKVTKQEKRRRNHLNSEKRRRENIKGGMDSLVELVPSCRNVQESKANILKKTREYMLQLLQGYNNSQSEITQLRQENQELRRLLGIQNQSQQTPENIFRARQGIKESST